MGQYAGMSPERRAALRDRYDSSILKYVLRRKALVVAAVAAGLLVAAAAVVVVALPASGAPRSRGGLARCPRHAMDLAGRQGIENIIGIVAALHRDVPRAFHNLTSMGEPAWPKYDVSALYSLASGSKQQPAPTHRAWLRARALCGAETASRSWSVTLYFPLCQLPCAGPYTAYLSRAPRGWVLWYPWLPRSE